MGIKFKAATAPAAAKPAGKPKVKAEGTKTGRGSSAEPAEANTPKKDTSALPLDLRYRPHSFDAVVGHESVVSSLKVVLKSDDMRHAFLFTGPAGTGKTTLARITATMIGVPAANVMEIDAATNSGVDNMRNVTEMVRYKSLRDGAGTRFVIIDECHALSKATWQSLLKILEEPPEHVYWALCTTEPDKVPETIRQRCNAYHLRAVGADIIQELLERVNEKEQLGVTEELLGIISRHSNGSPRRALVYLGQVKGITDKKEALRLLETGVGAEEEAITLARMLCNRKGLTWANCMQVCKRLEGETAEGVRLVVVNYAAACMPDAKEPEPLLAVLEAFKGPYNTGEKWAPLYLSLGNLLLAQ